MTPGYHSCYRKSSCENAPLEFHFRSVEFRNKLFKKPQWNLVPSEKKTNIAKFEQRIVVLLYCMYVCIYVCIYVCMYVYMYVYMCAFECMYVCVCVC